MPFEFFFDGDARRTRVSECFAARPSEGWKTIIRRFHLCVIRPI